MTLSAQDENGGNWLGKPKQQVTVAKSGELLKKSWNYV